MTRWRAVVLALLLIASVVEVPRATATPDDDCTRQSRRVRLPGGFAEARLSFTGILASGRNRVGEQFLGGDLRELRIGVTWVDAEHAHMQRLELYSPDGSLYQRFITAFTGDRRSVAVTTRLPVAGTSITDSGLYGEWCAEVFLDNEDAPIARRRFEIVAP